jgi:hypothetical protein
LDNKELPLARNLSSKLSADKQAEHRQKNVTKKVWLGRPLLTLKSSAPNRRSPRNRRIKSIALTLCHHVQYTGLVGTNPLQVAPCVRSSPSFTSSGPRDDNHSFRSTPTGW